MTNEDEARKIAEGVHFWGYHENECGDEGGVFPFSSADEAHKYAHTNGLEQGEFSVWSREPTDDERNMMEYGAWLALEAKE